MTAPPAYTRPATDRTLPPPLIPTRPQPSSTPPDPWGTPRAAALTLARLTYIPLALHQPADTPNGCTCYNPTPGEYERLTCDKPGKHPRHKWKELDSAAAALIPVRRCLAHYAAVGVGLKMGPQPLGNLWTLDIDPDGLAWLVAMERRHGPLPPTPTQDTPRGGAHWAMLAPADGPPVKTTAGEIADGVDTRGRGGMIVAAPSLHKNGGRYAWRPGLSPLDVRPALAPAWLLALVPWDVPPPAAVTPPTRPADAPPDGDLLGLRRWAAQGKREGDRDNGAYWLACVLAREGVPSTEGAYLLETFAAACSPPFDRAAALEKWNRAERSIPYQPRPRRVVQVVPPPALAARAPDAADLTPGEAATLIAELAAQCATLEARADALAAQVAREQEHRRWTNELMSLPHVKDSILRTLYWMRNQIEQQQQPVVGQAPNPDAAAALTLGDLAVRCDKSAKMIKRHIQTTQDLGYILEREIRHEEGPNGETLTRIYVTPAPVLLTSPAALPAAPVVNRGGARHARWCPVCRSPMNKVLTVQCLNCGTVYEPPDADADAVQDVPEGDDQGQAAAPAPFVHRDQGHVLRQSNRTSPPPLPQPGQADPRRADAVLYAAAAHAQLVESAQATITRRAAYAPLPDPEPPPARRPSPAPAPKLTAAAPAQAPTPPRGMDPGDQPVAPCACGIRPPEYKLKGHPSRWCCAGCGRPFYAEAVPA